MTTKPNFVDQFTQSAKVYDEKNRNLSPIADNMHFLIRMALKEAPVQAHVLCVGAGTGAEILSLAKEFPQWTFVGVDPSQGMLEVCRENLKAAGVLDRCELIQGYSHEIAPGENFDITMSVLVAHFVKREDRIGFYQSMTSRLRKGGFFVNAEISYDLNSTQFPFMFKNWEQVQLKMGGTSESVANLSTVLRDTLTVTSPTETEKLLQESGIKIPVRFYQAFMISAWYGMKT